MAASYGPKRCAELREGMLLPGHPEEWRCCVRYAANSLRACYAMSGTDIAYSHMRYRPTRVLRDIRY
eukprot:1842869-Rhodomonas_salina.4